MSDNNIINVVDIEATCWEGKPPPGEINEIIEIGITPLNRDTLVVMEDKKRSIPVRPIASRVSPFCTKLTGWTQEELERAGSFHSALEILRNDYDSLNRPWMSWGAYDRNMFKKQCMRLGYEYPFSDTHYNMKELFAFATSSPLLGMDRALRALGLPLIGRHHNGADDSYNIARIARHVMWTARERNEPFLLVQST